MDNQQPYFKYWGKARPESDDSPQYHLLAFHSLDVAAVGCALLKRLRGLRERLSKLSGFADDEVFKNWVVFFLALHDLGKFSRSFQNLRPDLLRTLQGKESGIEYVQRHDSLGYLLWKEFLRDRFIKRGLLKVSGSQRRRENSETAVDVWMAVVTGHHGKPPRTGCLLKDAFDVEEDLKAVDMYLNEMVSLFINASPHSLDLPLAQFKRASWWLAGFSVLCDWIGSNRNWFPYCTEPKALSEYWAKSLDKANSAVEASGLVSATASSFLSLEQLLRLDEGKKASPTPLQALSRNQPVSRTPQLVIMEDVTGAGKTEAALLLAHRIMKESGASGIYIGLPTMATANGMYKRVASVFQDFFDQSCRPSLVLAHGARNMDSIFRQSIFSEPAISEQSYGDDTEPAAAWCNEWLADNTKKALLADMGVGTIDQSLLGILPSKYQSLRLIGLLGKVLIVDEVHACDAYMHKLLCDLLKFHAGSGGSAILLSATLPKKQRQSLLRSFAEGLEHDTPLIEKTGNSDYPLLTYYAACTVEEKVIDTRPEVRRDVGVRLIHDQLDVEESIAEAVSQGRCVCWIRNTVSDARDAWRYLKAKHKHWKIDLFHARFILADRIEIENKVLDHFGPKSQSDDRAGRVLIATQVVEQSLDLDFDLLITDLAPIDLIIQRAGRLQRHSRDNAGNRIDGRDQRGVPELIVHGPEYTDKPVKNWVSSLLSGTAAIYPHHGQLWITSRWLSSHRKFSMPEDARDMVESVYGEEFQNDIPETLLGKSLQAEGEASANASEGGRNMLKLEAGYSDLAINQWWDEAITPTRLGEKTTLVYLARWENGELVPFRDVDQFPWQNNSFRMRTYWINDEGDYSEIPHEHTLACKEKLPGKGKWGVLLPLIKNEQNEWVGTAQGDDGIVRRYQYESELGLYEKGL